MRLITVTVPAGTGKKVADLAFEAGAKGVTVEQVNMARRAGDGQPYDVVDAHGPAPVAKAFIEAVMDAPFYDPQTCMVASRHPTSLVSSDRPEDETKPTVTPTVEVFEELWQFTRVTVSLVARVFMAALLVAYGMIHMNVPVLIAGLLFLPYHHHMLAVALGLCLREWRLLRQGLIALVGATGLIVAAGMVVAAVSEPPMKFSQFGDYTTGVAIGLIIGVAAGFAAADDAGRRELIGLAATAHITILPAWLGVALVFGPGEQGLILERCIQFALSVGALILAATAVLAFMGMRGKGVRTYARKTEEAAGR